MLLLRAGAGLSPRRATHFLLLRQKKVSKEKATPSLRPLRFAPGQTCVVSVAGCAVELALRCARRSDSHGESVQEARALRRACHPATAPPQAQPAGGGQPNIQTAEQPRGPLLRSARFRERKRCAGGAERSKGPCGCPLPGFPSGCAEERSGQRIRARDCLSATQWSEFERDPAGREHRRLPVAKRRDAACRVAFSLVTFSWRSKRKPLRRRAHTPASALNPSMQPNLQTGPDRLSPTEQSDSWL